jgi:hypothetical protein
LYINGVSVTSTSKYKITIPISQCSNLKTAETKALIDCGTEGKFVHSSLVNWSKVHHLKKSIPVQNVDGTANKAGALLYKIQIHYVIKSRPFKDWFYVTKLSDQKLILGLPWLHEVNPAINWATGTVSFPDETPVINDLEIFEELEDEEITMHIRRIQMEELIDEYFGKDLETDHLWIQAKTSASQALTHKHEEKDKTPKIILPKEFKPWEKVFNKQTSERFPVSRIWDHAIDLKPGFKPKIVKNYPLLVHEEQLMNKWIDKQLRKGYIRPSQLPQASPFFYVAKKEKGELRPCQDYRYINSWTKRNAYPLPLVTDLLSKL